MSYFYLPLSPYPLFFIVGDTPCRLALASCIVQFSSANFDTLTNTKVVASLLEGMEPAAIKSHVKFLCSILGTGGVQIQDS